MDFDRLKHSLGVARKMVEIGKKLNLSKEELDDLFLLGYVHDIGYELGNGEDHAKNGGNLLRENGFKYYKEVYYHGEVNSPYESLYLDILMIADMQIDKYGIDQGFDGRLEDIKSRYGEESMVYKKCYTIVKRLKLKYKKIF